MVSKHEAMMLSENPQLSIASFTSSASTFQVLPKMDVARTLFLGKTVLLLTQNQVNET